VTTIVTLLTEDFEDTEECHWHGAKFWLLGDVIVSHHVVSNRQKSCENQNCPQNCEPQARAEWGQYVTQRLVGRSRCFDEYAGSMPKMCS
jgi:hypothetical protein